MWMVWISMAWSAPTAVAAVGEPWQVDATPRMPGWSSALADCLEERAPANFAVLDQTVPNATLQSLTSGFTANNPLFLVIGVHVPSSPLEQELAAWRAFVDQNKHHKLLLVGPMPAPISAPAHAAAAGAPSSTGGAAPSPSRDAAAPTEGTLALGLTRMAASLTHVVHLDLQHRWDPSERAALFETGGLTARGHALLAALLCDEILRWSPQ